jgi:hypothetical protein
VAHASRLDHPPHPGRSWRGRDAARALAAVTNDRAREWPNRPCEFPAGPIVEHKCLLPRSQRSSCTTTSTPRKPATHRVPVSVLALAAVTRPPWPARPSGPSPP